jgi:hypothetical protein
MAQYDSIALAYQELADAVPLREPEWYSLRLRLGDLTFHRITWWSISATHRKPPEVRICRLSIQS